MGDLSRLESPTHGRVLLEDTLVNTPVPQASSTAGRRQVITSPGIRGGVVMGDADALSRIERRMAATPGNRASLASNASSLGLLVVDSLEDFPDETAAFQRFLERSSSQESGSDTDHVAVRPKTLSSHLLFNADNRNLNAGHVPIDLEKPASGPASRNHPSPVQDFQHPASQPNIGDTTRVNLSKDEDERFRANGSEPHQGHSIFASLRSLSNRENGSPGHQNLGEMDSSRTSHLPQALHNLSTSHSANFDLGKRREPRSDQDSIALPSVSKIQDMPTRANVSKDEDEESRANRSKPRQEHSLFASPRGLPNREANSTGHSRLLNTDSFRTSNLLQIDNVASLGLEKCRGSVDRPKPASGRDSMDSARLAEADSSCVSRDSSYLAADLLVRKERELALRAIRRAELMQRRRDADASPKPHPSFGQTSVHRDGMAQNCEVGPELLEQAKSPRQTDGTQAMDAASWRPTKSPPCELSEFRTAASDAPGTDGGFARPNAARPSSAAAALPSFLLRADETESFVQPEVNSLLEASSFDVSRHTRDGNQRKLNTSYCPDGKLEGEFLDVGQVEEEVSEVFLQDLLDQNVDAAEQDALDPFSEPFTDFTVSSEKFFPADSSLFKAELDAAEAAFSAGPPPLDGVPPMGDLSRLADTTQADMSDMEAFFQRRTEPLGALGGASQRPCFGRPIRSPIKSLRPTPTIESIAEVSRSESQRRTSAVSQDNDENVSPQREDSKPRNRQTNSPGRLLKDNTNIPPQSAKKSGALKDLSNEFDDFEDPSTAKQAVCQNTTEHVEEVVKEAPRLLHPGSPEQNRDGVELSAWDGDAESEASDLDAGWMLSDETAPPACPHVAALANHSQLPQSQADVASANQRAATHTVPSGSDGHGSAGSGGSAAPNIHAAKRDLVWTAVALGKQHRKALVIKNPAERSTRLVAYVPANSPFKLVDEKGDSVERRRLSMSAHEALKLSVVFAPTTLGPHAAALHFAPATGASLDSSRLVRLFGCAGQARLRVLGAPRDAAGCHWMTLVASASGSLQANFELRNSGEVAMFAHLALAAEGLRILGEDVLRVRPSRVVVPPGGSVKCNVVYQAPRPERCLKQLAQLTISWGEETTRLRLRRLLRRYPDRAGALDRSFGLLPRLLVGPFEREGPVPGIEMLRDPEGCASLMCDSLRMLRIAVLLEEGEDDSGSIDGSCAHEDSLLFRSLHEPHSDTLLSECTPADDVGWSVLPTTVSLTPPATCSVIVRNWSPSAQTFEVASSCAWLRVQPAQGCLLPQGTVELVLMCAAQRTQSATALMQVMMENDMREVEVHLRPAKILVMPPLASAHSTHRHSRPGHKPPSIQATPLLDNKSCSAQKLLKTRASIPTQDTSTPAEKSRDVTKASGAAGDGPDVSALNLEDLPLGPSGGQHSLVAAVFSDNYQIRFPPTLIGQLSSFKLTLKNTSQETRTMQIRHLAEPFLTTTRRYELKGKWFLRFRVYFKPTVPGLRAQYVVVDPDVGPPLRFLFSGIGVTSPY